MSDNCEKCGQRVCMPVSSTSGVTTYTTGHQCSEPDPRIMAKLEEILKLVKLTHDHVITD